MSEKPTKQQLIDKYLRLKDPIFRYDEELDDVYELSIEELRSEVRNLIWSM